MTTQHNTKKPTQRLYVGNIAFEVTEEELSQLFSSEGHITFMKMGFDNKTNRHKGFAFIEYDNVQAAQSAYQKLNNHSIHGRQLKLDFADPQGQSRGQVQIQQNQLDGSSKPQISIQPKKVQQVTIAQVPPSAPNLVNKEQIAQPSQIQVANTQQYQQQVPPFPPQYQLQPQQISLHQFSQPQQQNQSPQVKLNPAPSMTTSFPQQAIPQPFPPFSQPQISQPPANSNPVFQPQNLAAAQPQYSFQQQGQGQPQMRDLMSGFMGSQNQAQKAPVFQGQINQSSQNVPSTGQSQNMVADGSAEKQGQKKQQINDPQQQQDQIANMISNMEPQALYTIIQQAQALAKQKPDMLKKILTQNPNLARALFQAQIKLGMIAPNKNSIQPSNAKQTLDEGKQIQIQPKQNQQDTQQSQQPYQQYPLQHQQPQQQSQGIGNMQGTQQSQAINEQQYQNQVAQGPRLPSRQNGSRENPSSAPFPFPQIPNSTTIANQMQISNSVQPQLQNPNMPQVPPQASQISNQIINSAPQQLGIPGGNPTDLTGLLQSVIKFTPQQIDLLPPEQKAQVLAIKQYLNIV